MGLAVLFIVAGVVIVAIHILRLYRKGGYKWSDSIWHASSPSGILLDFLGFCIVAVIFGGVGLFLSIIPDVVGKLPYECIQSQTQSLELLRDGSGISGQFYIGSGYVNSYLAYYYYTQDSDGAIEGNSLQANEVKVYQDDRTHPRIETFSYHLTGIWGFFFTPMHGCTYIIHIPPGSINNSYQLQG